MDIRSLTRNKSASRKKGATSFQMVVLFVPVLLAFMGFAVDYGRLYMIRAELQTAANAAALASAQRLAGFEAARDLATEAANLAVSEAGGFANKIDYGGRSIGAGDTLTSNVDEPYYAETVADATETDDGSAATGTLPVRHVRITLTAQAPTVFFRFLPLGQEGRVDVRVRAVAGASAPLCVACGIEPIVIAVPPGGETDSEHFGFVVGSRYTLGFTCNGQPQPQPIPGSLQRVPYLLLNRYDLDSEVPEQTQAFRIGVSGLPGNVSELKSCINVTTPETIWESAAAVACNQNNVPSAVRGFTCGLASRFEQGLHPSCESVPDGAVWADSATIDTDPTDTDDYQATYAGNARRVVTIAIAETLADPTAITILGFRQFLLNPVTNTTNINPLDNNGRFLVTYIGSPVPLKTGRVSGCPVPVSAGPSKVVLHQ